MENQNTESTVSSSLGMSEERNDQLVSIVIAAIEKLGKTEKVNRLNSFVACEKELPLDISRTELLYMGYMIQYKAEQFAQLQQLEEIKTKLFGNDNDDEENQTEDNPVDPSAN
jgi:hypothetical protein